MRGRRDGFREGVSFGRSRRSAPVVSDLAGGPWARVISPTGRGLSSPPPLHQHSTTLHDHAANTRSQPVSCMIFA